MPQNNNHTNCSSVSDFDDACKQLYPTLAGASSEQVHEQQPTTPEAPMAAPAMTSPTDDEIAARFAPPAAPTFDPNIGVLCVKPANQVMEEAANKAPLRPLFGQLFCEGDVAVLFSDSNMGKSILALQIADAISRGTAAKSFEDVLPNEAPAQRVLYFDFEMSDRNFLARYTSDAGHRYEFSPNFFWVTFGDYGWPESGDEMEEIIKTSIHRAVVESEAKVVIVDNITYMCGDAEKGKSAALLMKWLKELAQQLGLSMLVVAHTPKRNLSLPLTQNSLGGSKMIFNFTTACFAIGGSREGKQYRYIKELKQRNTQHKYDSDNVIVCEVCKPDNFLMLAFKGFSRESDQLRSMYDYGDEYTMTEQEAQVVELSKNGKSVREIAEQLGMSKSAVGRITNKCGLKNGGDHGKE